MGKGKLAKFKEMISFQNVIQPHFDDIYKKDHEFKGLWRKKIFCNENPIIIELGCGKGEYTVGMAKMYPDKNFIGIDIKGARMWKGAKEVNNLKLQNAIFLRTRIEFINSFFSEDEVSEIWLTFPDPQLKKNRIKKRLTSSKFLSYYSQIIEPAGSIHLKTDSEKLFEYTLQIIEINNLELRKNIRDIYNTTLDIEFLNIKTYYELMFLEKGEKINYLEFKLSKNNTFIEP